MLFDDWDEDSPIEFDFIDARKKSRKEAHFRISELEIVDYEKHKNPMEHNATTSFNASFTGIFWAVVGFSIFLLSLFGLVAVIRFFVS